MLYWIIQNCVLWQSKFRAKSWTKQKVNLEEEKFLNFEKITSDFRTFLKFLANVTYHKKIFRDVHLWNWCSKLKCGNLQNSSTFADKLWKALETFATTRPYGSPFNNKILGADQSWVWWKLWYTYKWEWNVEKESN